MLQTARDFDRDIREKLGEPGKPLKCGLISKAQALLYLNFGRDRGTKFLDDIPNHSTGSRRGGGARYAIWDLGEKLAHTVN